MFGVILIKRNTMNKEPKAKVHMNDIVEAEGKIPVKAYIVGNKVYNSMVVSKESLATHTDCDRCKQEFEKPYTYSKYCQSCEYVIRHEKYLSLPLVEWDGESALSLWDDDQYFFSIDEIQDYCEEHELKISDLKLVLCEMSSFTQIDFDLFVDETHEDWEPSDEMIKKVNEFNSFLEIESTNTWFPANKRVILSED